MRKGNIIAGIVCAAVALYVIVTCLGYPRAAAYGTGVPGPGLWPGHHRGISSHLLCRTDRRNPDDEKRRSSGASDVDAGNKTCIHFHGDPAGLHAGVIYSRLYHSVRDHAVCILPVVPQRAVWKNAVISIAVILVIYFVFKNFLNVPIDFGMFSI